MLKLCKDCQWMAGKNTLKLNGVVIASGLWPRCAHPSAGWVCEGPDPVTGRERDPRPPFCHVERLRTSPCGEDARLFEARPA
ncbi:MAG: hypothetical protein OXC11_03895 [Rhodospirillales bacterium]|nr:hypothetical protein [Rhodospirillales bacterium]